jgi:hypothetical protein
MPTTTTTKASKKPPSKAWLKAKITAITSHHRRATSSMKRMLDSAIQCGLELITVKERLPHGSFLRWIKENLNIPARTCQHYMELGRHADAIRKHAKFADLEFTVTEALALIKRLKNVYDTEDFGEEDEWEPVEVGVAPPEPERTFTIPVRVVEDLDQKAEPEPIKIPIRYLADDTNDGYVDANDCNYLHDDRLMPAVEAGEQELQPQMVPQDVVEREVRLAWWELSKRIKLIPAEGRAAFFCALLRKLQAAADAFNSGPETGSAA